MKYKIPIKSRTIIGAVYTGEIISERIEKRIAIEGKMLLADKFSVLFEKLSHPHSIFEHSYLK